MWISLLKIIFPFHMYQCITLQLNKPNTLQAPQEHNTSFALKTSRQQNRPKITILERLWIT